ncbi:MAG: UDP-3-O-(3-hydroxymyristoyl)glucosamine N-acyltransferase [bacterium]
MSQPVNMTVREIADLVGGEVLGDPKKTISGVASLEGAGPDEIGFLGSPRMKEAALKSKAGALIVSEKLPVECVQILVSYDPYAAFVKVMEKFRPEPRPGPGVHESAAIMEGVSLGERVHVGAHVYIGENARVGDGTTVAAGAVIGAGCRVGADCYIHPQAVLYPGVRIGDRVILHAGTIIGSDGFGFILSEKGHIKKPQVGSVVVEDDVEMGANCTVDRAMLDNTVIGAGTKFDNMVHVAHNVRVGKSCIILAGTAVGGSTAIGDGCVISGGCVIKDNITLGDRVNVVGHSAVSDDIKAGETVWGLPAIPFSRAKRVYLRLKQLPELFKRVRELEKKMEGNS